MLLYQRVQVVLLSLSPERQFGALRMKCSLDPITNQKEANFKNTLTCPYIIVSTQSYCAYHQSFILELLRWNAHLTLLRPKRRPSCKIHSHASESPFLDSLTVLITRTAFSSSFGEILTLPHYETIDGQFGKYCHTRLNNRFKSVLWCS